MASVDCDEVIRLNKLTTETIDRGSVSGFGWDGSP
jgi:hypothetical protein